MKNILKIMMLSFILFGCENEQDFLDTEYNGVVSVKKVSDYDLLLNARLITAPFTIEAPFLQWTDNYSPIIGSDFGPTDRAAYLWDENIYAPGDDPTAWRKPYERIFTYNTILNDAGNATNAESNKDLVETLKAEALLGRAFEYWVLLNLYAPPYDGTNGNELSVPFVETADITAPLPDRMTIEALYNQIVSDVETALPSLPEIHSEGNHRGSKLGAYAFLSRLYLFKKEYNKVIEYADLALGIKDDIDDYTDEEYSWVFDNIANNEKVYSRPTYIALFFSANITEEFGRLYFTGLTDFYPFIGDDVRPSLWFYALGLEELTLGLPFFYLDRGLSTPEIWLNKAEALVRSGDPVSMAEGLAIVNELRAKRIVDSLGFGTDLISWTNDPEEILGFVLEERRKEMATYAMRWFDMRRLQLEGRIGTITHSLPDGTTATLEEGSEKYTLAIPASAL
ncbi:MULTISPECIES: RagB/SusD family nutrient uptake outer membrane protein [Flavobacteriaceae]|uniref:RagB/SusD family nutrient uptake outer membrane protein n=1 Tax=Flavobacteriaceae TaxID=49546 RepID=UPI001492297A|nr:MULTISPECIES: RagB/SusD family nutrient uptake outer membrane protein [Allomuricauda]MDC6366797.1 RagB/SusD family nutrient uptake outer membrane protein [Muricauda sp. AC10]